MTLYRTVLQLHRSPSATVSFGPVYVCPGDNVARANAANTDKIVHDTPKVDVPTAKTDGLQGRCNKAGTLLERIERLYSKKKTSKYAVNCIAVYTTKRACEITHPIQGRDGAIRDYDYGLCKGG